MRGFSLLEVITVVAVLAILGGAGAAMYTNFGRTIQTTQATYAIQSALKEARSRAVAGEDSRTWGVHFVNGTRDYYELYSTPTTYADVGTTVDRVEYLPGGITFSDPAESGTKDILFSRIAGTTTASSIAVSTQTENASVSVSAIGTVY